MVVDSFLECSPVEPDVREERRKTLCERVKRHQALHPPSVDSHPPSLLDTPTVSPLPFLNNIVVDTTEDSTPLDATFDVPRPRVVFHPLSLSLSATRPKNMLVNDRECQRHFRLIHFFTNPFVVLAKAPREGCSQVS